MCFMRQNPGKFITEFSVQNKNIQFFHKEVLQYIKQSKTSGIKQTFVMKYVNI